MKEKQWKFDDKHIDVLDGVRALAIFIVAWYHIWQISWKSAYFDFSWLGIERFQGMDATWFVRYGFEMVDLMLLLSGFCLFLPYARSMVYATKEPDIKKFYKKRVARIIPSYYFAIIVALIVANVNGEYATSADMRKDLIPHLFFVHTYFKESYIWSHLNGVLWTLAIEVQFYLLFPWIAKLFKKWTVQTYFAMVAVSWMFINLQIVDKVPQEYAVREIPGDAHGGTFREKNGGSFGIAGVAWLDWQFKHRKKAAKLFKSTKSWLYTDKKWVEVKTKNLR